MPLLEANAAAGAARFPAAALKTFVLGALRPVACPAQKQCALHLLVCFSHTEQPFGGYVAGCPRFLVCSVQRSPAGPRNWHSLLPPMTKRKV